MSLVSLILIWGTFVLLGEISMVIEKRAIRKNIEDINEFVDHTDALMNRSISVQEASMHISYILENYHFISRIINESMYKNPIMKLGSALSYGNRVHSSLHTQIVAEKIEFNGAKGRELVQLTKKQFNPFTMLYKGVELVMFVVFGYIIRRFKPDFNPYKSNVWKVLNAGLAVLGSITSILSFLSH